MQGNGPALVVSGQSTTIIPPHYSFAIDGVGTLIAARLEPRKISRKMKANNAS
jgi:5-oxoprolinase (ATP-hydrolysing)